jgi:hypothetical protein
MNPWFYLVLVGLGCIIFLYANENMLVYEGKNVGFEPSPLFWQLNLYGFAMTFIGLLALKYHCDKYLLNLHNIDITEKSEVKKTNGSKPN